MPRLPSATSPLVNAVFGLAIAGLAAVFALGYSSVLATQESFREVEHTHTVVEEIRGLELKLGVANAMLVAYRTNGDERELVGYPDALATAERALTDLKRLTAGDENQQARLDVLEKLVAVRRAQAEDAADLRRKNALDAGTDARMVGKRLDLANQIRSVITAIGLDEAARWEVRADRGRADNNRSHGLMFLGTAIAVGVLVIVFAMLRREVDARKKTAAERDRFFELSLDMIGVAGVDGYFKSINRAGQVVLGRSEAELLATPFLDFVHPDDRLETAHEAERANKGGVVVDFENRYQHRDGSYRWMQWRAVPDVAKSSVYFVARDVTEKKSDEERVEALNAELGAKVAEVTSMNQELESFSYSVSHDLRSPLRSIDGFSQVLLEDFGDKLDDEGRGYLGRVRSATQRMGQLIDDMLDLSRIGRVQLRHEPVDLVALARPFLDALCDAEPDRKVRTVMPATLPTQGDSRLLRILLENLLSNAWKFTSKHDRAVIELGSTESASGAVAYFVRDDGAGFDMTFVSKLFGPFQRLHAMTDFPGTGVGLAIVQRIAARHGGSVWAEGAEESGATFFFTLG